MLPPTKDFRDQVSPSAIVDSPQTDSRAIHQPNSSQVNSFQVANNPAGNKAAHAAKRE